MGFFDDFITEHPPQGGAQKQVSYQLPVWEGGAIFNVLDLFSGIGGFSLGLERTGGFRTVAFCEIDRYCRQVIAKHWPDIPCYEDVQELTKERLQEDGISVDVICGGFPCQDISTAGKRAGIKGTRSGLWSEYARLIRELRPSFIIVENVAALLHRGMDTVLGDLASIGYDAEWHCISASSIGAPHQRDRVWIVAYHHSGSEHARSFNAEMGRTSQVVADSKRMQRQAAGRGAHEEGQSLHSTIRSQSTSSARPGRKALANTRLTRLPTSRSESERTDRIISGRSTATGDWWTSEPSMGRMVNGVPKRVDRLRALGNAVVPQIPEIIGHAILRSVGGK
jgi:DNA (cytosine-5)-methyltransferase 1